MGGQHLVAYTKALESLDELKEKNNLKTRSDLWCGIKQVHRKIGELASVVGGALIAEGQEAIVMQAGKRLQHILSMEIPELAAMKDGEQWGNMLMYLNNFTVPDVEYAWMCPHTSIKVGNPIEELKRVSLVGERLQLGSDALHAFLKVYGGDYSRMNTQQRESYEQLRKDIEQRFETYEKEATKIMFERIERFGQEKGFMNLSGEKPYRHQIWGKTIADLTDVLLVMDVERNENSRWTGMPVPDVQFALSSPGREEWKLFQKAGKQLKAA